MPARAARLLASLAATQELPAAPPEAWPDVLRAPPWRVKGRTAEPDMVLDVQPVPTPFAYPPGAMPIEDAPRHWVDRSWAVPDMDGLAAMIERLEEQPSSRVRLPEGGEPPPAPGASPGEALSWIVRRLTGMDRISSRMLRRTNYAHPYQNLPSQPAPLALALWELPGPLLGVRVHWPDVAPRMLHRFGEAAVPGLVRLLQHDPALMFPHALAVDAAEIAPVAAHALLRLRKARASAIDWLRAHRRTALLRLIPDAVGTPGEARDAAEHALRWFAAGNPDGAEAVAEDAGDYTRSHGPVTGAIAQVLNRDPLLRVPARVPKLPVWASPGALSQPVLHDGGALPDEAVTVLLEMLSFSVPGNVYAGVPLVWNACTPASLAAFAWDLFSAWLGAGTPAKDGWAMRALGWLGDDECARQLTRLIRRWPGESAHARAVTGLDVLADIGTDVALMNLNGIAEKLKFKGLQDKAREKIAAVAEARDISPEELPDHLAPDLDLDERGGLDLDFGSRRFRVGFDEYLAPVVRRWGALFGDYEIAQPFPQLGRETYAFTDAERAASTTDRFAGVRVGSGRLRCMAAQGWLLGAPGDGGWVDRMERPVMLSDGRTGLAVQDFGQGLRSSAGSWDANEQTLATLQLHYRWSTSGSDGFRFGDIDLLTASEMLRGLVLLAASDAP